MWTREVKGNRNKESEWEWDKDAYAEKYIEEETEKDWELATSTYFWSFPVFIWILIDSLLSWMAPIATIRHSEISFNPNLYNEIKFESVDNTINFWYV